MRCKDLAVERWRSSPHGKVCRAPIPCVPVWVVWGCGPLHVKSSHRDEEKVHRTPALCCHSAVATYFLPRVCRRIQDCLSCLRQGESYSIRFPASGQTSHTFLARLAVSELHLLYRLETTVCTALSRVLLYVSSQQPSWGGDWGTEEAQSGVF